MRGNRLNLNEQLTGNDTIYDAVLQPRTGGAVALPLARECLTVETGNLPQTERSRNCGDVFPLFVPNRRVRSNAGLGRTF